MKGQIYILLLLVLSCSSPKKDKIVIPKLHAEFYADALERINNELKTDPKNVTLIDQKLFYCEEMGWPTNCITALDAHKELYGMTGQLIEKYITYYQIYESYIPLLMLFEEWNDEFDMMRDHKKTYINCLSKTGRYLDAKYELRVYLSNNQENQDLVFAATQYLEMGDSLIAAYNINKLYNRNVSNDLLWPYGQMLVKLGYNQKGFEVMRSYVEKNKENVGIQTTYAQLLTIAEKRSEAREVLKPFRSRNSVAYLLADLYQKDMMWDSAVIVLKTLSESDTADVVPLMKLGTLYEERGWYATSLKYFENLYNLTPEDTLVRRKIEQIKRKIAYLQRLKFEEDKIPVIELEPIKNQN